MNLDSKKFFSPIPNYEALREKLSKTYHKPTREETRSFLNFWQEIYNIWKLNYSPFEIRYTEEKVKIRKQLVETFGFRS